MFSIASKLKKPWISELLIRGDEGIRTPDLFHAEEALSQLSYTPIQKKCFSDKSKGTSDKALSVFHWSLATGHLSLLQRWLALL